MIKLVIRVSLLGLLLHLYGCPTFQECGSNQVEVDGRCISK